MTTRSRLLMGAAVVLAGVTGTTRAQQNTLIEPDSVAALTRMGGYLRSLRAFQVEAVADERARANPHGVGSEMPWGERHAVDTLRPSSARTR